MRRILLPLAFVLVASTAMSAEQVVFRDGRSLVVERLLDRGDVVELELRGGGRLAVPFGGIEEVRRFDPEADDAARERTSPEPGWRAQAGDYAELISTSAARHRLAPELLTAMVLAESNFDPFAVSPKGACGLLQLIPDTARRFGVRDVFDPADNVEGGARYLRWLLDRFDGDLELAVAAYNAGERVVERYGGVPPYPETVAYVAKVLQVAAAP